MINTCKILVFHKEFRFYAVLINKVVYIVFFFTRLYLNYYIRFTEPQDFLN